PTSLYTLSLHDALPICLRAIEGIEAVELHVLEAEDARRQHAARRHRRALEDIVQDGLAVHGMEERRAHPNVIQRRHGGVHAREEDRKSTRLNSSHLGIS